MIIIIIVMGKNTVQRLCFKTHYTGGVRWLIAIKLCFQLTWRNKTTTTQTRTRVPDWPTSPPPNPLCSLFMAKTHRRFPLPWRTPWPFKSTCFSTQQRPRPPPLSPSWLTDRTSRLQPPPSPLLAFRPMRLAERGRAFSAQPLACKARRGFVRRNAHFESCDGHIVQLEQRARQSERAPPPSAAASAAWEGSRARTRLLARHTSGLQTRFSAVKKLPRASLATGIIWFALIQVRQTFDFTAGTMFFAIWRCSALDENMFTLRAETSAHSCVMHRGGSRLGEAKRMRVWASSSHSEFKMWSTKPV